MRQNATVHVRWQCDALHKMRTVTTHVAWSVCLSVCLSVGHDREPRKTAELIEVPVARRLVGSKELHLESKKQDTKLFP